MKYRENFADNISKLRKEKNITLQNLANVIGVKNQSISTLEKGKTLPSFSTLTALADFFNVSIDYLVGRTENPEINK